MARFSGVNVPANKRVHIALTYVHGIGLTGSKNICKKVGITEDKRINNCLLYTSPSPRDSVVSRMPSSA